jgi:hypothetical protein
MDKSMILPRRDELKGQEYQRTFESCNSRDRPKRKNYNAPSANRLHALA